jgi:hypothetical protein
MCGAPERLTAFGARTYHNNNGSETTVVKTVELSGVVYHVAEPARMPAIIYISSLAGIVYEVIVISMIAPDLIQMLTRNKAELFLCNVLQVKKYAHNADLSYLIVRFVHTYTSHFSV